MTIEERLSALEQRISTMELQALAEKTPTSYYTSKYSGEEIDALLDKVAAMTQELAYDLHDRLEYLYAARFFPWI